jgi:DNA-binding CsgD family transcriptional regulator
MERLALDSERQKEVPRLSSGPTLNDCVYASRDAIAESNEAKSLDDLNHVIRTRLRELVPHRAAAWGHCDIASSRIRSCVNIDYPATLFTQWLAGQQTFDSPIFELWKKALTPQFGMTAALEKSTALQTPGYRGCMEILRDHRIENAAGHGVVDVADGSTSFFSLGQLDRPMTKRDSMVLTLVIPHLHAAHARIQHHARAAGDTATDRIENLTPRGAMPRISSMPEGKPTCTERRHPPLSRREIEVLKWAHIGKTNSEIGMLLNISEFTVKNHIGNILQKLGASNRTHAVAKAVSAGTIPL